MVAPTAVTYGQVAGNVGKYPRPDQVPRPDQGDSLIDELESNKQAQLLIETDWVLSQLHPKLATPSSPVEVKIVTPCSDNFIASVLNVSMVDCDVCCYK
jgi:hypothetical protein